MLRALCLLLFLFAAAGGRDARAAPAREASVQAAMALPEELRRRLPPEAADRGIDDATRVQALVDFMIADDGLALRYQDHPTYGIAESLAQDSEVEGQI